MKNKTYNKRKMFVVFCAAILMIGGLIIRMGILMIHEADYYQQKAEDLHERERDIKAARGEIVDRTGTVLATNRTVCTISVIYNQVTDPETVIRVLGEKLGIDESLIRKKVEKISSREVIKSNVEKEIGDEIRNLHLNGVKVDEDYKRYYPHGNLASKVLGFTGSDNQGIIGLEVKYEEWLKGIEGKILTTTDARGIELEGVEEDRVEPVPGKTLQLSLDYNIQKFAQQSAEKVMEEKQADAVCILIMNPKNGEIYACVNVPEFDLNEPFTFQNEIELTGISDEKRQELLNQMWRNRCINDTYEPGSIFKIVTAAAALEEGKVSLEDTFFCPGYKIVEDRRIRCAKVGGHGSETFVEGIQNSCNPVFMEVGSRLGVNAFYKKMYDFKMCEKTGVDLPGEANTILHKKENVGGVELATMSFGQSFQVTPIQMITTASMLINGGKRVTPHFAVNVFDETGEKITRLKWKEEDHVVSERTSEMMKSLLEGVVSVGGGKQAYIEGYRIGGKTATSQTLPRSARKYISSFIGFAPAEDPEVIAMTIIYNPKGIYYGGLIAAPVVRDIFDNILPYLGVEKTGELVEKKE